jgi:type II secretory pathway predicted ATPase ExeA
MLEELRIISNVNCEKDPLLQVVLVGQPTLLHTLRRPDLVQLVQRIAVHCHLDPLGPMDTAAYIRHRLDIVDGSPHIFDDLVCASVYYFTGGIPRLINMLCDQAMMHAYSDDLPQITYRTVIDVVADRNRLGVSAFRDIPEGWATSPPPIELMTLVKD